MNPMKSILAHSLIFSLILTVGYLSHVHAVTDAELEALEKQIEQQEVEEKQKADAEAKRKAELEKQQWKEAKRIAEKKRKEEEAKRLTGEEKIKRKTEGERLREEQEARAQAEEEAQRKEKEKRGQFSQYMKNGDSAMNNKKYTEALRIYTQALEIFPSDSEALTGQSSAREFKDACAALSFNFQSWKLGMYGSIATKIHITLGRGRMGGKCDPVHRWQHVGRDQQLGYALSRLAQRNKRIQSFARGSIIILGIDKISLSPHYYVFY